MTPQERKDLRHRLAVGLVDENGFGKYGSGVGPKDDLLSWIVDSVERWDLTRPTKVVEKKVGKK